MARHDSETTRAAAGRPPSPALHDEFDRNRPARRARARSARPSRRRSRAPAPSCTKNASTSGQSDEDGRHGTQQGDHRPPGAGRRVRPAPDDDGACAASRRRGAATPPRKLAPATNHAERARCRAADDQRAERDRQRGEPLAQQDVERQPDGDDECRPSPRRTAPLISTLPSWQPLLVQPAGQAAEAPAEIAGRPRERRVDEYGQDDAADARLPPPPCPHDDHDQQHQRRHRQRHGPQRRIVRRESGQWQREVHRVARLRALPRSIDANRRVSRSAASPWCCRLPRSSAAALSPGVW